MTIIFVWTNTLYSFCLWHGFEYWCTAYYCYQCFGLVWGEGGGNLRFFEAFKQAWKEGGLRVLPQEFFPRIYDFFLTYSDIDSDDAILDWNE